MRNLLLAFFALLAGLSSTSAIADELDWWWLGGFEANGARMSMHVDRTEVRIAGKTVDAWVYHVVEKPFPDGEVMSLTRHRVDCRQHTISSIQRYSLDQNGKQISATRFDALVPDPIKENTSADVLRRHLCRDKPLPATSVTSPTAHAMRMWGRVASKTVTASDEPVVGYGTGFFVNSAGALVTSYHVIDGAKKITVYTTSSKKGFSAEIVRSSPATDLVVLQIDFRHPQYLTLAPANSAKPGDRVFTFGFPVVEILGSEPKYTDGAISSLSGIGNDAVFAQISVPVQPGNSGGPLVNEQGAVVGVVAAQATVEQFAKAAGALPQNVNWAVRSEYLAPLIGRQSTQRALSRGEAVALARQAVVVVVVEK